MVVIKLNFSITIPDRLAGLFVALLLLYRLARYGYAFRRIKLTQGKYAIVDPEDFERLNKHKWYAAKDSRTFYATRKKRIGKKFVSLGMHRQILNPPAHLMVDHINHNGLDNRKANLRLATCAQNTYSRRQFRKNKSSKYTGVSWKEWTKKWAVIICYKRKNIIIGYFDDEIQAAKAYDKAAKKYHGEFASLNFPD
ncbi:MAG: HNH endonuclease [Sedimentisphaerales bacterium]|nr:HNH endonuclease [Sedimentisphaerales bacterium]